ncbi:MAG: hypothetical protein KJZ80_17525 [Hyphomicrobiaceae bacterium]|nr:hypothetical protein [Hyphomicrobiaceae bacterium]
MTARRLTRKAAPVVGGLAFIIAAGSTPLAAQSLSERAKCGVFFDKWNVKGAPASTLAMAGLGHEVLAANDCISQNNPAGACAHYRKIEAALGMMGPTVAADVGANIKDRLRQLDCR